MISCQNLYGEKVLERTYDPRRVFCSPVHASCERDLGITLLSGPFWCNDLWSMLVLAPGFPRIPKPHPKWLNLRALADLWRHRPQRGNGATLAARLSTLANVRDVTDDPGILANHCDIWCGSVPFSSPNRTKGVVMQKAPLVF